MSSFFPNLKTIQARCEQEARYAIVRWELDGELGFSYNCYLQQEERYAMIKLLSNQYYFCKHVPCLTYVPSEEQCCAAQKL